MLLPTNAEILALLDKLESGPADEIESQWIEFKPCRNPKDDMKAAVEYAVCFANAEGGVVVFGVLDQVRGRERAIEGAKGYDIDTWRRGIYAATRPSLAVTIEELAVPEGTGRLLVVRVPKGDRLPYGTAEGLYKKRVGKNCMPLDAQAFARAQVTAGIVDWSGEPAPGVSSDDLDPVEIARARNVLRKTNPESELLRLGDSPFLAGLGVVRGGAVTCAGLLLFGRASTLHELCPQHHVHYVHETSGTRIARNDSYSDGLLAILERLEQAFSGPANPEREVASGFFRLRIPAYPVDVVREVVLNAVTHRDYADPGEVLIRHTPRELVVTSPGGFIAGITTSNILRVEPISRNRTLAEAFQKLRLVERAGVGRRRIFIPLLSYGKRMPRYEADAHRVTLRIFDGSFDERMATLVSKWQEEGREIDLDGLLLLSHLKENAFVDTGAASELLQLPKEETRAVLDHLALPRTGFLERRGRTKAVTYHLSKGVAKDLLGQAAYTKIRGLNPIRYAEMVKAFLEQHEAITPSVCRELLGLGDSPSARVEVSRHFKTWTGPAGFLDRVGTPPRVTYRLRRGRTEPI